MKALKGFSLIELLVVIAIIALLLSIALPSLKNAKDSARQLMCFSNLRQMGIALKAYLEENKDRLPPSSCHLKNQRDYWLCILEQYAQSQLLYKCPSDKNKLFIDWNTPLGQQSANARWSSYAVNSLLDSKCPVNGGQYARVSNIKRPAYCVYISEAPDSWTKYDHIHPENWGSIEEVRGQVAWNRHRNTSNYIFADGHVEKLAVENTWDWPDGRCLWLPECAPGWPKP